MVKAKNGSKSKGAAAAVKAAATVPLRTTTNTNHEHLQIKVRKLEEEVRLGDDLIEQLDKENVKLTSDLEKAEASILEFQRAMGNDETMYQTVK